MGVRLTSSKTYKTAVNFETLNAEGKKENQSFIAEFKRISREEVLEMIEECKNDAEMCRRVLVGWKMEDLSTKENTEFNEENLEVFLSIPSLAGVTMLRFMETVGASRSKT